MVLKESGIFLPVGTGICPNCKRLLSGIKQTEMDLAAVTSKDSEITFKIAHISLVRWSILKTTLIRTSTQKSLQGLDYISAEGSQAFDELCHVVERLGDCFKGMTWTKEQKSELKSAKRYLKSDFKLHLDSGKHQRSLENETLYDKAVHGYAARLEEQFGGVPQMQQFTNTQRNNQDRPSLPMGWALKSSQTKRFSEKQKSYLSNQFLIGETTGQKANPASVAKAMMTVRDSNGNRIFTSDEFLT
ncbi:hypothetical protein QZH41_010981, partial [Actinostola sp. cb2023]